MKDFHIQLTAINALTLFTIAWGVYVFGLKRERFTFLSLSLHATPMCTLRLRELTLVQLSVQLKNKGVTR